MRLAQLIPALALAATISMPAAAATCSNTSLSAPVAGLTALGCAGTFEGNLNGDGVDLNQLEGLWTSYDFSYQGKTDDRGAGPFTANPNGISNNLTLNFDNALSGTFVIGLKAATTYSFYLFDALSPVSSLSFNSTAGAAVNVHDVAQGLSHAALYKATSVVTSGLPTPLAPVPEPETYAMILAGLGLLGARARRQKKA